MNFTKEFKFLKADTDLGLIFGYAIVSQKDGEDYYDLQDEHIPEDVMLEAATDFMKGSRIVKIKHQGESVGKVLHSFPVTTDIAKAFGLVTKETGWIIGVQPDDQKDVDKFISGEYTGFSIGGFGTTTDET